MPCQLNDIRSTFLNYFAKQGHEVVPSSPLVPRNDPTLMFVNSGMVQFKNLFTGSRTAITRAHDRAEMRAGRRQAQRSGQRGLHRAAPHVFRNAGNFQLWRLLQDDAIPFAWESDDPDSASTRSACTSPSTIPTTKRRDLEKVGVPEDRIIRIATSTISGRWARPALRPCTEIFYDHGDHIWGGPPGSPDEDGDRFIEIWNIVFMQNEQFEDGSMIDLDMQSIDTGMGLERIGALLQGSHDNYDTDLFKSLIEASAMRDGVDPYGDQNVHHRVIADHLRSTSFLIADGVMPSNDGRGYVLRRIMRRAMRHAHLLGAKDPVMYRLVPALVQQMGAAYPELGQAQALITETLEAEETRFKQTLDRGLRLLDDEVASLSIGEDLPGRAAFKLYDTYGFPLDLTQDALREKGYGVDTVGFDAAMAEQKAKARAAWSGSGQAADEGVYFEIAEAQPATDFLGYETETAEATVIAIVSAGQQIHKIEADLDGVWVIFNQTPFYAEAGGQVADHGFIRSITGGHEDQHARFSGVVSDVHKKPGGLIAHRVTVETGTLCVGDAVRLEVDHGRRSAIRANHSATHLLHEALREALGDHVAQRGSLNAPDRLRFDFSHSKAVTFEELATVESEVNAYIRQNAPVETRIMTPDDARGMGAQALFGEKYGDEVRVVSMGKHKNSGKGADGDTYSLELCGGTHVCQTGDIGAFVTLGDSASSAGVRRIEALTGQAAMDYLRKQDHFLAAAATELKAPAKDVPDRIRALLDERRSLSAEVAKLRRDLAMSGGGQAAPDAENVNGIQFFAQVLNGVTGKDLPPLIDEHKSRLASGAVLLIAEADGKVAVAAGVTLDKIDEVNAVDIVKAAVIELGGKGGGGRPDMAQGGAKDVANADAAIAAAKAVLGG